MYYTYVLRCFNSSSPHDYDFYIGFSADLPSRESAHKLNSVKTTKKFDKIELVYYEVCFSKKDALVRERQLKTGFGRGYVKRRIVIT